LNIIVIARNGNKVEKIVGKPLSGAKDTPDIIKIKNTIKIKRGGTTVTSTTIIVEDLFDTIKSFLKTQEAYYD
jgi:hypothetical protein